MLVLKNSANVTGKHLSWNLFLIKMQINQTIKKRQQHNGVAKF